MSAAPERPLEREQRLGRANDRRRRLPALAVAAVLAAVLAAGLAGCGGGGGGNGGGPTGTPPTSSASSSVPAGTGARVSGGTVTWAEPPDSAPDYIFPLAPPADFTLANVADFQHLMYRPLFWFGDDNTPTVDYGRSLGRPPVFSDG
ncbi:MAG TPA: hypothetical protein VKV25_10030, partial [Acidimicrobiales bacterium]|nr:hypothetical protein [Acidimicrobiales bacterium]